MRISYFADRRHQVSVHSTVNVEDIEQLIDLERGHHRRAVGEEGSGG